MTTTSTPTGTTSTSPRPRCDTSDMILVHRLLTSVFRAAPCLVRTVGEHQPDRRLAVSRHVAMIVDMLHNHHATEDVALWDDLSRRAPSCAVHVELMRKQHGAMSELLADVRGSLVEWDRRGGADDGAVSEALERLSAALRQHLVDEETTILGPASRVFSQREWDRLSELGAAHTPREYAFVQLGYLVESLPHERRREWVRKQLPLPVRIIWRTVGRRRFDRYRAAMGVDS